jgi:hypothetical protein
MQNTLKPKLIKTRGFNYAYLAKWTICADGTYKLIWEGI